MLTILSLVSLANAADGAFPYDVQTEVLDNGLTVHVIPTKSTLDELVSRTSSNT